MKRWSITQRRELRRRYIRRIIPQLYVNKPLALMTYARRMQQLGLYSETTSFCDICYSILKYVAWHKGYRHWGAMFRAEKDDWKNWRQ